MQNTIERTLSEGFSFPGAMVKFEHHRPKINIENQKDIEAGKAAPVIVEGLQKIFSDGSVDKRFSELMESLFEEEKHNVVTNSGRDFLHQQGYQTTGLGSNGLNYIALSNDTLTETTSSTTLSNEITTNGLGRAQGTVAHTSGTNTTTVAYTFTCATASQAAQKAALFTASSSGVMCHVLAFTQRTLQVGDTLTITFTITLG